MSYASFLFVAIACLMLDAGIAAALLIHLTKRYGRHPQLASEREMTILFTPRIVLESENEWVTLKGALTRLVRPV